MRNYYVNNKAQANGDHEVHRDGCTFLPGEIDRIYLGLFTNCHDAVRQARRHFAAVNGCAVCSAPCHTR